MLVPIRGGMDDRGPKVQPLPLKLTLDMYGCEPSEARLDGEPPLPEQGNATRSRPLTESGSHRPIRP